VYFNLTIYCTLPANEMYVSHIHRNSLTHITHQSIINLLTILYSCEQTTFLMFIHLHKLKLKA